jgi:hypothetical protein
MSQIIKYKDDLIDPPVPVHLMTANQLKDFLSCQEDHSPDIEEVMYV